MQVKDWGNLKYLHLCMNCKQNTEDISNSQQSWRVKHVHQAATAAGTVSMLQDLASFNMRPSSQHHSGYSSHKHTTSWASTTPDKQTYAAHLRLNFNTCLNKNE